MGAPKPAKSGTFTPAATALRVDPELETVVWPNEADLAPEFLREKLTTPIKDAAGRIPITRRSRLELVEAAPVHAVREERTPYRTRRAKKRT